MSEIYNEKVAYGKMNVKLIWLTHVALHACLTLAQPLVADHPAAPILSFREMMPQQGEDPRQSKLVGSPSDLVQ